MVSDSKIGSVWTMRQYLGDDLGRLSVKNSWFGQLHSNVKHVLPLTLQICGQIDRSGLGGELRERLIGSLFVREMV